MIRKGIWAGGGRVSESGEGHAVERLVAKETLIVITLMRLTNEVVDQRRAVDEATRMESTGELARQMGGGCRWRWPFTLHNLSWRMPNNGNSMQ